MRTCTASFYPPRARPGIGENTFQHLVDFTATAFVVRTPLVRTSGSATEGSSRAQVRSAGAAPLDR
jgi:hypothetical protein